MGGKGSDNDRGNSLKSYVKEGMTFVTVFVLQEVTRYSGSFSRAKTRIVISNTGQGADPDFGPQIVVERVINVTGGSSFTLKSRTGSGRCRKGKCLIVAH